MIHPIDLSNSAEDEKGRSSTHPTLPGSDSTTPPQSATSGASAPGPPSGSRTTCEMESPPPPPPAPLPHPLLQTPLILHSCPPKPGCRSTPPPMPFPLPYDPHIRLGIDPPPPPPPPDSTPPTPHLSPPINTYLLGLVLCLPQCHASSHCRLNKGTAASTRARRRCAPPTQRCLSALPPPTSCLPLCGCQLRRR